MTEALLQQSDASLTCIRGRRAALSHLQMSKSFKFMQSLRCHSFSSFICGAVLSFESCGAAKIQIHTHAPTSAFCPVPGVLSRMARRPIAGFAPAR